MGAEYIDIRGLDEVRALFRDLGDQAKPILVNAMNQTAGLVKTAEAHDVVGFLDRPLPATINSTFVDTASPLRLQARDYLKDRSTRTPPVDWMAHLVEGGTRKLKHYEQVLRNHGILKSGEYTVPTSHTELDANGNVPGRVLGDMLTNLRAGIWGKNRSWWVRRAKDGSRTIWRWNNKYEDEEPYLKILGRAPRYRKFLPFFETGTQVVNERLTETMNYWLEEELRKHR